MRVFTSQIKAFFPFSDATIESFSIRNSLIHIIRGVINSSSTGLGPFCKKALTVEIENSMVLMPPIHFVGIKLLGCVMCDNLFHPSLFHISNVQPVGLYHLTLCEPDLGNVEKSGTAMWQCRQKTLLQQCGAERHCNADGKRYDNV